MYFFMSVLKPSKQKPTYVNMGLFNPHNNLHIDF